MRKETGNLWLKYNKTQQKESTEKVTNKSGNLYSILFSSGNDFGCLNDIGYIRFHLLKQGIPSSDILMLQYDGDSPNEGVVAPATRKGLETTLDMIRQRASSRDRLLFVVSDHGGYVNGQCCFGTHDEPLYEEDFEKIIQDLPVNFAVFYFASCYSGGFAERVGQGRNIGISNSTRKKQGYGFGENVGNLFTRKLFPRLLLPNQTIEKAFDSAILRHTNLPYRIITFNYFAETPQLRWQNADPSELYLGKTPK